MWKTSVQYFTTLYGLRDARNAFSANLRSLIFRILRGSMPLDPLGDAKKVPSHFDSRLINFFQPATRL